MSSITILSTSQISLSLTTQASVSVNVVPPVSLDLVQNSIGPQGPAGADGAEGPQGPAGATGAIGPQGPAGPTEFIHPKDGFIFVENWLQGTSGGVLGWVQHNNSGGFIAQSTLPRIGVMYIHSGSSSTASPTISLASSSYSWNFGRDIALSMEAEINIANLATVSEDFIQRIGFMNTISAAAPTNGAWIEYNRSVSPNWIFKTTTVATGLLTTVISSIPVVAGTYYRLKTVVNADASRVDYYIDGVFAGFIDSNIPYQGGNARAVSPIIQPIIKTAGTGTRGVYLAWCVLAGGSGVGV